jgi:hypothetical protein
MKKYMEYLQKNKTVVEGEEIEMGGVKYTIGKMSPEEIEQMKKEGEELLETKVTYKGKETSLGEIKSGKDLFNITEVLELEGNYTGMWYVWRQKRMEERFNKLSEKAQSDLKKILGEKE